MEKIKHLIEETIENIAEMRYHENASKIAKDEKQCKALEYKIDHEIARLCAFRTALMVLEEVEEENGRYSVPTTPFNKNLRKKN